MLMIQSFQTTELFLEMNNRRRMGTESQPYALLSMHQDVSHTKAFIYKARKPFYSYHYVTERPKDPISLNVLAVITTAYIYTTNNTAKTDRYVKSRRIHYRPSSSSKIKFPKIFIFTEKGRTITTLIASSLTTTSFNVNLVCICE